VLETVAELPERVSDGVWVFERAFLLCVSATGYVPVPVCVHTGVYQRVRVCLS